MGVRLSDVLSADRLLLIEGPSDQAVLAVWFSDHLKNPRLAVIPASGGDNARYAHHLQAWLSRADRLGDRRVLYLRDRDELPEQELERLEKTGVVKVALGRELENYLLDEAAIAAVIQQRRPDIQIDADAAARTMRDMADRLQQTVVIKRVCRELPPIRLVDNDLRRQLGDSHADLPTLQQAVAQRLPESSALEKQIADLWEKADAQVTAAWSANWKALAPGEEVLQGIWRRYELGKYSKTNDGPRIAAAMASPPPDLVQILDDFLQ